MSYDLAIWHEPCAIDCQSAQKKYEAICSSVMFPAPHESVTCFVDRLTGKYPQIDNWDEDDIDNCPWSCEFDQSPGHCIIHMRWGAVEKMLQEIVLLAEGCGLVCYDPQNGKLSQKG